MGSAVWPGECDAFAASTSSIAHGSLDTAIDASGHDEITDIAQALVVFRDTVKVVQYE